MATTANPGILLMFAVPEEARPFVRLWTRVTGGSARRVAGPGLGSWELNGVRVHVTGMGRRNAARVGSAALDAGVAAGVGAMVTAGFAGGLRPGLPCGTVLMDADERFLLAPGFEAAGVRRGQFHEATRVAITSGEKSLLYRETGADAVEMESATLRVLARERGIPGATVRVISDAAGDTLPLDFNRLMTAGDRLDFTRLAWALVRSPGTIPRLMAFQKTVHRAADALARVCVETLGKNR